MAGEEKPAWTELKTKAGKDRKRLPLACIVCRRKKIRCSGEKPACRHCLRARIPCVYKVTTRKAAPRTDYMGMLEKRLKRMEERVIKIIPKDDARDITATGRAVVKPPLVPASDCSNKKRSAEEAFGPELGVLSHAKGNPVASDSTAHPASPTPKPVETEEDKLMKEGLGHLPSKEIQEHLAEVFFECVYAQSYHLLHKPSFMGQLRAGTVPPVLMLAVCAISARFSTHPQLRTEPAFLRGEEWAKPVRDIVLRWYDTPNITILTVYIMLGLHEFGTCQGGRSWSFGGMAQRMAYALLLHKDPDEPVSRRAKAGKSELSVTDKEIRRRTLWACFIMDRFNSSGSERPMYVSEQTLSVQLPVKEQYYLMGIRGRTEDLQGAVSTVMDSNAGQVSDPKDNMGVAAYFIRIVSIWGRLVTYLNLGGKERDPHHIWEPESGYADLEKQISAFRSSLPESLRYTPDNLQSHAAEKLANQFLLLHICYNQVILFMTHFALPSSATSRPPSNIPRAFLTDCAQRALKAAAQISILVKEGMEHSLTAPFAGYCAFLSSTVHIHGVFRQKKDLEERSRRWLSWNVRFLGKIKRFWGMFHYMMESLREMWKQYSDSADASKAKAPVAIAPGTTTPTPPVTPSNSNDVKGAIFQYGDWFDRYPHGLSRTDIDDPGTAGVKTELDGLTAQRGGLQSVEDFFRTLPPVARTSGERSTIQQSKTKKAKAKRGSVSEGRKRIQTTQGQRSSTKALVLTEDGPPPADNSLDTIVLTRQDQQEQRPAGSESQSSFGQQSQQHQHPPYPTFPSYDANRLNTASSPFLQSPQAHNATTLPAPPAVPSSPAINLDFHDTTTNTISPYTISAWDLDMASFGLDDLAGTGWNTIPAGGEHNNAALHDAIIDPGSMMMMGWEGAAGGPGEPADAMRSFSWCVPFNVEPPDVFGGLQKGVVAEAEGGMGAWGGQGVG